MDHGSARGRRPPGRRRRGSRSASPQVRPRRRGPATPNASDGRFRPTGIGRGRHRPVRLRLRSGPGGAGTTDPDEPTLVESQRSGPYAGGSDGSGLSAGHPQDQTDPDPTLERSGTAGHDPDLARTAPVEPGLPGSTAASPYGPSPTVDKAAHPSEPPAEPPRAPDEAGWAPGAAGSFEEHEPLDRPAGASDRWREAKLTAERDRIARAAASQPEERSPLERARRRLERLVGGGQDHPDPEISPADREAAERARRARLGMDEDDRYR